MDKETVLKLSRKENEHKYDECQLAAIAFSYKVSRLVGGAVCALLACIAAFLFDARELSMGVCAVYFSMAASGNLVRFSATRRRENLIFGIIGALVTVISLFFLFRWLILG